MAPAFDIDDENVHAHTHAQNARTRTHMQNDSPFALK